MQLTAQDRFEHLRREALQYRRKFKHSYWGEILHMLEFKNESECSPPLTASKLIRLLAGVAEQEERERNATK